MIKVIAKILLLLALVSVTQSCGSGHSMTETESEAKQAAHPNLTLTQSDVSQIRAQITQVPKAQAAFEALRARLQKQMESPMNVPTPKDAGGGFTHEQHKRNYQLMYDAGLLFQITQEQAFADYVSAMLLEYAELYPNIGIHPKRKEQSPGKLFWQSLNEAVWLVHVIQAYDMVVEAIAENDRKTIESDLLLPVADFLSAGQPETFNKIHNHGTWAAAAVGMTGYVLGSDRLVTQALYGLDMSGTAGFLKQIDNLFSPDGYYAEGPYYQRYALMPFVLFAKAIEVNEPNRKIFEYRDQTLLKAIRTAVQLSYNKLFFGINDAIKDKGIDTIELVHGTAIAYEITQDPTLLSISERQDHVLLTGYGFKVAQAISDGLAEPFQYQSMQLRDGKDGDQGALTVFRNGIDYGHQALVMKNTSQGLGHGHFDKLHWLYFDNGNEIISDYGAARFLNIEAKYGGHYLPENNAWAKQTVAHNTVVVDEKSQFGGDWREGQKFAPTVHYYSANDSLKITSASIDSAYPGVELRRTMAMVNHAASEHPLIIDVFDVRSQSAHQYDLPLHYQGQFISQNFKLNSNTQSWAPLGAANGYQFLWNRGQGDLGSPLAQVTWLNDGRFYTYSTIGDNTGSTEGSTTGSSNDAKSRQPEKMIFAELGANDPDFNLKRQSVLIHRVPAAKNHTFVSVLEQHGEYNGRAEYTVNAKSSIASLTTKLEGDYRIVAIEFNSGELLSLITTEKGNEKSQHSLDYNDQKIDWVGHFKLLPQSAGLQK